MNAFKRKAVRPDVVVQQREGRDDACQMFDVELHHSNVPLVAYTETVERQKRIASLKAQIEAGTYHIDTNLLAQRLLDSDLTAFHKQQGEEDQREK